MSAQCQILRHSNSEHVPSISITPSNRRVSLSVPIRFTRTFSEDSIDSLEKNGRLELRRQRILTQHEQASVSYLPTQPTCPHLRSVGRARTELDSPRSERAISVSPRFLSKEGYVKEQSLAEIIGVTSYQMKMMIQYWPQISAKGPHGDFAHSIYSRLCSKSVNARQLLAKANTVAVFAQREDCTTMHIRWTIELIVEALKGLDHSHVPFTEKLQEIGRIHRHLRSEGLTASVWDELGDAIIDCVRTHATVKKHRELRRAWLALVAYITDTLKQGQRLSRAASNIEICPPRATTPAPRTPI